MLVVDCLSKTYPTGVQANKDISFQVKRGGILALVGPNGSGKTTLMRQLLGVLSIGEGSIDIDGQGHRVDLLSYCPQASSFYPGLTVRESLKVVLSFLHKQTKESQDLIEETLERLDLLQIADQLTYTLSGGQSKKLALAACLVQNKDYLILDEVTAMIDIHTKEKIWQLLLEERNKGKAILLSSHDMTEIKRIAD